MAEWSGHLSCGGGYGRLPLAAAVIPPEPRPGHRWFDLHPDGKRFVVNAVEPAANSPDFDALVMVTNVFDELQRRSPATR